MRFIFFFSFVFTDGALNMGKDIAGSLDRFDLAHVSNARISRFFKLIHIFLFFSPQRIMHVQIHISFVTIKHWFEKKISPYNSLLYCCVFFDFFVVSLCVIGIENRARPILPHGNLALAERDSGGYGSVGSPVGGPECRGDYDGLQAQCDEALRQLQLLRHKHTDTIRRFVLLFCFFSFSWNFLFIHLSFFFHRVLHARNCARIRIAH